MAHRPATLEPAPATRFKPCGYAGCTTLATHVVVAGGARQFLCCAQCGALAIAADLAKPGKGWGG